MIPDYLKRRVRAEVFKCLRIAEEHYGKEFPTPKILFTLRSRTAGTYKCKQIKYRNSFTREVIRTEISHAINFNPYIIKHNFDEFIKMTPAHEVAHLVTLQLYGTLGHGPLWKAVMTETFGKNEEESKPLHSMETPKKLYYIYDCSCKKHYMSNIRHNKIRKGFKYRCKHCKGSLTFTGQVEWR